MRSSIRILAAHGSNMSKLIPSPGMASVEVRAGLGPRTVKEARVLVIGRKQPLLNLPYATLEPKLAGHVSETDWEAAKAHLSSNDSASLSFGSLRIQALTGVPSRHECGADTGTVSRASQGLLAGGATAGDIVLAVQRQDLLASVAAAAKAFPLFSTKTGKDKNDSAPNVSIELLPQDGPAVTPAEASYLNEVARSVRDSAALVDMPCSILNTDAMVAEAHAIAAELGVTINVVRGEELKEGGFGGIYSVGRAASFPPALVVLSHTPAGADKTLALVGKGIVYDTGGMQIKTKTGMPGMKRDMGGSAAVLTGFRAAVKGGYKQNLHCLLCLAENNIGAEATKPDDIITMLSGKSVEINNTDAEGRLVLGDGVYYARQFLKADTIMDMATLTGAQAIATGKQHAALVSNSDALEERAVKSGRHSGDLTFPIVFAPNLHFDLLSSAVADMKNSSLGKTEAASSVAALFIAAQINFAEGINWLHVDMAAPVYSGERATGYGPALIQDILGKDLSQDLQALLLNHKA